MRTTSYADLLSHTTALAGLSDPTSTQLATGTNLALKRFIQRRVRQCWEMAWWPETMRSQERFYRADYAAGTAYVATDEVYYPTTGLYYRALTSTTGNAPTDATKWEESPTDFDPYISLTQTGKDAIGKVRFVGLDDPLATIPPRSVAWQLTTLGIEPLGSTVAVSVYVWFQLPAPLLTGTDYASGTAYSAGATIYYSSATAGYEGDFYTCLTATSAGQTPETHSAKWEKQAIPSAIYDAVAHYATADYLRSSGQREAAPLEESAADAALARAITSGGMHTATNLRHAAA